MKDQPSRGSRGSPRRGTARKSSNKPSGAPKEKAKKSVNDYNYYLGSAKQASDYENTTQFLVNYIQKTFDYGHDMSQALRDLEYPDTDTWKPTLQFSTHVGTEPEDDAQREAENKQYEIEFKSMFDSYVKRTQTFKNNKPKAYSFLWERCAKGMKNKIESRTDYDNIQDDPIELLKAIKEHALNYQEQRYSQLILVDAWENLMNTKQQENESLQDYTKRFRVARDVMEAQYGGPPAAYKYVEQLPNYDPYDQDAIDACRKTIAEQYYAVLYLKNADQKKYGSILRGLNTQKTLHNDQYPKTVVDANNVLSNHRFDKTSSNSRNRNGNNRDKNNRNDPKNDDNDKDEQEIPLSFAQLEDACYCCGKKGHRSPDCRDRKKIPREEWAINKASQSHVQASENANKSTENGTGSQAQENNGNGWAGVHHGFYQASVMKNYILLDNESTDTIFCNPDMVTNIREVDESLTLTTNAGVLTTNLKADIPGWGEAWFAPNSMTNIFSYAEMADRYRITYDNEHDDSFCVHLPHKKVKFTRENGLYLYKPPNVPKPSDDKKALTDKVQLLETVDENKKFYTKRQFERAKRARELLYTLGYPTINDMKAIIRMNTIKNNPVTTEDVDIAQKIFGPDIATLKGKTTRRTPVPVVEDRIEIPRELITSQYSVTLCLDGMKVNDLTFLTTISKNLMYRTARYVERTTMECYRKSLQQVLRVYTLGGLKVTMIRCDNEFRPLMDPLALEFGIQVNYASPQEHVPEAERNNRVVKERIRTTYHRMPYDSLPRIMVKFLVDDSARKLNYFPAKNGVSPYYSPRMILHQKNLDFDKHCQYPFGTYVQAHDEPDPSNTNAPRTLDCIYLRYNDNAQGGHDLLHLQTNRTITRRRVTPIPITPAILKMVHRIAANDGMPKGLKISNRTGQVLYDSTWIAGVDYDEEEFEDEDDEDYDPDSDRRRR